MSTVETIHELSEIDRWFLWKAGGHRRAGARDSRPRTARRASCSGRPSGPGSPTRRSAGSPARPRREFATLRDRSRHGAGLQDGRYLRRRVRGGDAVLLLHLRGGGRSDADRRRARARRRLRPDPDRAGHRVRLLLGPGGPRAPRCRRRLDHDQLQPGDRLDRLRRLRPPLLRAARCRERRTRSCGTRRTATTTASDAAGRSSSSAVRPRSTSPSR